MLESQSPHYEWLVSLPHDCYRVNKRPGCEDDIVMTWVKSFSIRTFLIWLNVCTLSLPQIHPS